MEGTADLLSSSAAAAAATGRSVYGAGDATTTTSSSFQTCVDEDEDEEPGLTTSSVDSDPPPTVLERPSPPPPPPPPHRGRFAAPATVTTSLLSPARGPRSPAAPRHDTRRLCPPKTASRGRRSASMSAVRPSSLFRSRFDNCNADFGEPSALLVLSCLLA